MESISVSIRVRPLSQAEKSEGSPWVVNDSRIILQEPSLGFPADFSFDNVFNPAASTEQIFQTRAKQIARSVVDGFNGTIFAYGQTSSGKTHTMRGAPDAPGIIPLCINEVFTAASEAVGREFLLRVSYLEIYNEEINDLLCPDNRKLQIHENFERGIFVAGLREEVVISPDGVLDLLNAGEENRSIGETKMNQRSSRSHTIFRMVVESRELPEDEDEGAAVEPNCEAIRVATLNLVDLAGSERVSKTGAEGQRLKEGGHINKSLMTLGTVINKLSEGVDRNGGHIPFRDSKLTRILQPALGGNTKTAIICCMTPARRHEDESLGTLRFAQRAKKITNVVSVNEILDDQALLKRQRKEIEELRRQLEGTGNPHLAGEMMKLRNALLQMEIEKDLMAAELEESRIVQEESIRRMQQQEQKIERMKTLMLSSAVQSQQQAHGQKREEKGRNRKGNRRETWCPPAGGIGPNLLSSEASPGRPHQGGSRATWLDSTLEEKEDEEEESKKKASLNPLQRGSDGSLFRVSTTFNLMRTSDSGHSDQSQATAGESNNFPEELGGSVATRRPKSLGDSTSRSTLEELHKQLQSVTEEKDRLQEELSSKLEAAEEQLREKDQQLLMVQEETREQADELEEFRARQEALLQEREEERCAWHREKLAMQLQLEEDKAHIEESDHQLVDVWAEVRAKEQAISALQAQLAAEPADLTASTVSTTTASTMSAEEAAELSAVRAEVAKWRASSTALPRGSISIVDQVRQLVEECSRLAKEAKEHGLMEEAKLMQKEVVLEEQVEILKDERDSLQDALAEAEASLASMKEELEKCKSSALGERSKLDRQLSTIREEWEGAAQEAQAALEQSMKAKEQAEEKASSVALEAAAAATKANAMEAENESMRNAVQEHAKHLLEAQTDIATLRTQKVNLEKRLEQLSKESEQAKNQAAAALQKQEEKARASSEEVAELRKELVGLRKQLAGVSARPAALEKEREGLSREVDKCKAKIHDLEAKLKSAVQDKATFKAEHAKLEKEVKALRGQSTLLTREVNKKESTQERHKGAVAEKERLLAEKIEEVQEQARSIAELQAQLQAAEERCYGLEAKLREDLRDLNESKKACSDLGEQIQAMQVNLVNAEARNEQLEAQLDTIQKELAEKTSEHELEKAQLQSDLEEEHQQFVSEAMQHEQDKAASEAMEKTLQSTIKQLKIEIEAMQEKMETTAESARALTSQAQRSAQDQLAAKSAALTEALKLKDGALEEAKSLKVRLANTVSAKDKAEKKAEQVGTELTICKQALRRTEEEAKGLREELEWAQKRLEESKARLKKFGDMAASGSEEQVRWEHTVLEEQRQLAEQVAVLHAKLQQAMTSAERAEFDKNRAEENLLIAREEVERLQEKLQVSAEEADSQTDTITGLGHRLMLAEEHARKLEDQVEEMEFQEKVGTPGGVNKSPLARTGSKGVEAALRVRIDTLERELKEVYALRENEQEVWKAHTVDRKRRIDGLTERLTCSEEQRMQLERLVKITQRERQRDMASTTLDAASAQAATREKELVESMLKTQEQARKAVYHLDRLNKKYASLQVQYDQALLELQKLKGRMASAANDERLTSEETHVANSLAVQTSSLPASERTYSHSSLLTASQGLDRRRPSSLALADILVNKENLVALNPEDKGFSPKSWGVSPKAQSVRTRRSSAGLSPR